MFSENQMIRQRREAGVARVLTRDVIVKTSHPGRMAPNTATCFTLIALAIAVSLAQWSERRQSLVRVILVS